LKAIVVSAEHSVSTIKAILFLKKKKKEQFF